MLCKCLTKLANPRQKPEKSAKKIRVCFRAVEQLADELVNRRSGGAIDERLTGGCAEAMAILDAHGLDGSLCMALLDQLETRCRRALGAASRVNQRARAAAQRWFQGIGLCRQVFVEPNVEVEGHT